MGSTARPEAQLTNPVGLRQPASSSTQPTRKCALDGDDDALATVAGYYMQYADGWRLDAGADVDPGTINDPSNDYWEGFRNTVTYVNSDGYITGEEALPIAGSWAVSGTQLAEELPPARQPGSLWRDSTFTDNDHNSGSSAGELAPITMS